MKKIAIVIFIILGCNIFIGKAQERGFQISGKIDGILEGTLFLMSDEKGKLEVLDTTSIMNGAFVFTWESRETHYLLILWFLIVKIIFR